MNSEQKRINFNQMVAGYINCALWADVDEENADKFTWLHLSGEALAVAHVTCKRFVDEVLKAFGDFEFDDKVGYDLWLTQNGHGAGFWDGDYDDDIGEVLTDIAQSFGETYIYLGDDDKIYIG